MCPLKFIPTFRRLADSYLCVLLVTVGTDLQRVRDEVTVGSCLRMGFLSSLRIDMFRVPFPTLYSVTLTVVTVQDVTLLLHLHY